MYKISEKFMFLSFSTAFCNSGVDLDNRLHTTLHRRARVRISIHHAEFSSRSRDLLILYLQQTGNETLEWKAY